MREGMKSRSTVAGWGSSRSAGWGGGEVRERSRSAREYS